MKTGIIAVAAALASGVVAREQHGPAHRHAALHEERGMNLATNVVPEPSCECTTITYTITGPGTLYNPPTTFASSTSSRAPKPSKPCSKKSSKVHVPTSLPVPDVPTPIITICPTPGVYTIPAKTITLIEPKTVCPAASITTPPGPATTTAVCDSVYNGCIQSYINAGGSPNLAVCAGQSAACAASTSTAAPTTTGCPNPDVYPPGTYVQPKILTTVTVTDYVIVCPFTAQIPTSSSSSSVMVPTSSAPAIVVVPTIPAPAPAVVPSAPAPAIPDPSPAIADPVPAIADPVPAPAVVPSVPAPAIVDPAPAPAIVVPAPAIADPAPAPAIADPVPAPAVVPSVPVPAIAEAPSSAPVADVPSVAKVTTATGDLGGTSGPAWAITYSPYDDAGACKTASAVLIDITLIASKGFKNVRVYSTDCSGLANIGAACEAQGLKIILGVFISSTGISGAAEQVTDIVSWGKWSLVELIVVGNECVFSGFASAGDLVAFITSTKSTFGSAGYNGQYTTAEPLNIWQENTEALCAVVDIVGANLHPYFNAEVVASGAGEFVAAQLELVDALCPGKTGMNLETGWPSAGTCNGKACPGVSEQAEAVASIVKAVGTRSVMFSFVNDLWKPLGAHLCEQSWGSIHLFN